MAYSNGVITAPVSIYDVQQAAPVTLRATVGGTTVYASSNDVGVLCGTIVGDTVVGTYTNPTTGTVTQNVTWTVTSRSGINKWARFKPMSIGVLSPLTHSVIASTTNHFGLDLITGSWNTFKTKLGEYVGMIYGSSQQASIGTKAEWGGGVKHNRPTGTLSSPYRLTDFVSAENNNFGYKTNAELLYHWPDYSHTAPSVSTISSAINGLIQRDSSGAYIYLDSLPSEQYLPDDNSIFSALTIPLTITGKTHNDYNSISAPELIKTVLDPNGIGSYKRGVVLVDTGGWVDEDFNAVETVPWGAWKNSQDEASLYGEWVCIEYYYNTNNSLYCMIPGFEYLVDFKYGSSPSQNELAFAKDPAIGYVDPQHSYYMFISFRQLTTENLSNWDVYVSLIKEGSGGAEITYLTRANLTTFTTVTSGSTWYQKYVNVDYNQSGGSSAGDTFKLKIEYKPTGTSQAERTFWLTNIVLTT